MSRVHTRPEATAKRWWIVSGHGFGPREWYAETAAKAKMADFKAGREMGYYRTFSEWMSDLESVRLSGDQGDPRTPEYGVAP